MSYIKNIFLDIKEKTKGMSLSDKVGYLWEYYRIAFFFITFFAVCAIALGGTIIGNSLKKPVVNVGVLNDIGFFYEDELNDLLAETFPDTDKRTAPQIYSFTSPANEDDMYAVVQLAAYLGTDSIDCGICDTATLEYITNSEVPVKFTDISDSKLGRAMEGHGLKPLYFFYFEDSERSDAAALLKNSILNDD